jgi:hypothetical protein
MVQQLDALGASSSVGPFGYACAPLYASEHVKQRALGKEPTGRRSALASHLVLCLTNRRLFFENCNPGTVSKGLFNGVPRDPGDGW